MMDTGKPPTVLSLGDTERNASEVSSKAEESPHLYASAVNWIPRNQEEETILEQANDSLNQKLSRSVKWKVRARSRVQMLTTLSSTEPQPTTSGSFDKHLRQPSQAFRTLLPDPLTQHAHATQFTTPNMHMQSFFPPALASIPPPATSMVVGPLATSGCQPQPIPIASVNQGCNGTTALFTNAQTPHKNVDNSSCSPRRKRCRSNDVAFPVSKSSPDEDQQASCSETSLGTSAFLLNPSALDPRYVSNQEHYSHPILRPRLHSVPPIFPAPLLHNWQLAVPPAEDCNTHPVPWLVPPSYGVSAIDVKKRSQHKRTLRRLRRQVSESLVTWGLEGNLFEEADERAEDDAQRQRLLINNAQRSAIVETMVESCKYNPSLQEAFLGSAKHESDFGVLKSSARKLLAEGPFETSQEIASAWANILEKHSGVLHANLDVVNTAEESVEESDGAWETEMPATTSTAIKSLPPMTWSILEADIATSSPE